jgi:predicted cation transporter
MSTPTTASAPSTSMFTVVGPYDKPTPSIVGSSSALIHIVLLLVLLFAGIKCKSQMDIYFWVMVVVNVALLGYYGYGVFAADQSRGTIYI